MIVAFCGIDGSGKSSHIKATADWLREYNKSYFLCKPLNAQSNFYKSYRKLTVSYEQKNNRTFPMEYGTALLAMQLLSKNAEICEHDKCNEIVLLDRWKYSHYAFAHARGNEPEIMRMILNLCTEPDLVFLFDLPEKKALERIDTERENRTINEDEMILKAARARYLELAQENTNFVVLDSLQSFETNQKIIQKKIVEKEEKCYG